MSRRKGGQAVPTLDELRSELKYERYKVDYRRTIRSTISILITVENLRAFDDADPAGWRDYPGCTGIRIQDR